MISLTNNGKNAQTTVTCFDSTNSTVHVSGLRFSWNQKVLQKNCYEVLAFFFKLSNEKYLNE